MRSMWITFSRFLKTKADIMSAVDGHILGYGELAGLRKL
jgi:hypothetical protein